MSKDGDTTDDAGTTGDETSPKGTDTNKSSGEGGDTKTDDPMLKTTDVSGLKKALAEERKQRQALEKAARDAELAKLPELERAQTEALHLKDANEKLTTENMRLKTGLKLGMPWSLAKRLTGDTEEEMQSDAADLMKDYRGDSNARVKEDKNNKRPPNDAKKNGSSGLPDMNQALRALRLGR